MFLKFLIQYVKHIHPSQYKIKTNKIFQNKKDFLIYYYKSLKQISKYEMIILSKYMKKVNEIFSFYGLEHLNKLPWKFRKSIHDIEGTMPYTLHDTIILNENMINKMILYKQIQKSYLNTLFHERLHIIQRYYQSDFDKLYKELYTYLYKDPINISNIPLELRKKLMTNPDNNFTIWRYKLNQKIYFPIFENTKYGFETVLYFINNNHELDFEKNEKMRDIDKNIKDHPNETFTYNFCDFVFNKKKISDIHKILFFLRNLKKKNKKSKKNNLY